MSWTSMSALTKEMNCVVNIANDNFASNERSADEEDEYDESMA